MEIVDVKIISNAIIPSVAQELSPFLHFWTKAVILHGLGDPGKLQLNISEIIGE